MVWSPLSNLLLYGATANVKQARARGVRIALGSDWSPTGSKNLLGELKVARLASLDAGDVFSEREIVALATREAAAILKWEKVARLDRGRKARGPLRRGRRDGRSLHEPSEIRARRRCASSSINGVPRFGHSDLMKKLGASGEAVRVGGKARTVNLEDAGGDPVIGAITLSAARKRLDDALHRLPKLARDLERGRAGPRAADLGGPPVWFLALDELAQTGIELRPRLPLPGRRASTGPLARPTRRRGAAVEDRQASRARSADRPGRRRFPRPNRGPDGRARVRARGSPGNVLGAAPP